MKHNFKNLNIWKNAMVVSKQIYLLTSYLPKSEEFGLKSQMRRCSVSIASNIAEGSSRTSNKDFNRFLEISLGSLFELQTQLLIGFDIEFFTKTQIEKVENDVIELQKMIAGFQKSLL